jgi:TPR repeat protein
MKKYLFVLVATMMALVGCTDQHFLEEGLANNVPPAAENGFAALIEQARWGDGQAFLKLADCYRDGNGVEKDFVGMLCMVAQADEFGGIGRMEDYLKEMPENSDFRTILDAIEKFEDKQIEEAKSMSEQLVAKGSPDGYTVQGIMAIESGDTLEGIRMMEMAASKGSSLAKIMLCVPEFHGDKTLNIELLKALSDDMSFASVILANMYTGEDDEKLKDESLAAYYFLKADENACLTRRGARWLMYYHRCVSKLPLSERDIQRLQILAGETSVDEPASTKCKDEALEAAVSQLLQEKMTEKDCKTGAVYIVETQTGSLKANVSLMRKGNSFVPYEDTYTEEQSNMLCGPTYLALLSSGKFSSDYVIDTEFGIYKDVRDHNWYRGGYGQITLEQALGCRSLVAFTKAKEVAFGNEQSAYNQKIASYLATNPSQVWGILSFYNAVANGGRMVQLVTEGDDVIVLDEQIAAPEHIATLQHGLQRAVSQGLFRKAGRDYTNVAACGRTFWADKKTRRMELCGYFPADNPIYTIMVVLEKNGFPASAGGMCAPIMASTVDIIVDSYSLHSVVAQSRNMESVEEPDAVCSSKKNE